jgi:MtN3 and saliva related transmembrane protein
MCRLLAALGKSTAISSYDAAPTRRPRVSDTLAVIAAMTGVVMATAPALQIRRMFVTRSSKDVSIAYLAVLLVGFGVWIAYGISLGNLALIVPNSVAIVTVATIAVARRFRSRSG